MVNVKLHAYGETIFQKTDHSALSMLSPKIYHVHYYDLWSMYHMKPGTYLGNLLSYMVMIFDNLKF